ncbi:MAG: hypothetical protein ACLTV6_13920 [Christensenellales bacterium]
MCTCGWGDDAARRAGTDDSAGNLVVNAQRAGGKEAVRVTLHPDGFDADWLRHDERTDRAGV